jgi:hypothetical protein
MRANIVGPPRSATRIRASIAACPCAAVWTFFGSPMMYLPASRRTQHAAAGQDDRVVELGGPIANDGRPTCGIVRRSYHRSRRRSQQLDRRRAERDGRVHDPDGGPHWPSPPILLGGWRSYQPRKRANRKRLLSATRRSRRAWPIFPGWRSRISKRSFRHVRPNRRGGHLFRVFVSVGRFIRPASAFACPNACLCATD